MNLLKYELKKILTYKSFQIFVVAIIGLYFGVIGFQYSSQDNPILTHSKIYTEIINEGISEEKINLLRTENSQLKLFQLIQSGQLFDIDKINSQDMNDYQEFIAKGYDVENELVYNEYVLNQFENVFFFQSKIDKRIEDFKLLENSPMWNMYNDNQKEEYNNSLERIEDLKDVNVVLVNTRSTSEFITSQFSNVIMFIAIIGIGYLIFFIDEQASMNKFFFAYTNGKKYTFFIKLIVFILMISIFYIILNILGIIFYQFLYGSIPYFVSIQSIPLFSSSTEKINVLTLLIQLLMYRLIVFIFLTTLFCTLYHLFKQKTIAIITFILLIGIEIGLYYIIPDNSFLSFLRNLNIYSSLLTHQLYINPVHYVSLDIRILSSTIMIIDIFLFSYIYIFISTKQKSIQINSPISSKTITLFLEKHTSLWYCELYKLFKFKKTWIWIIVLISIQGIRLFQQNNILEKSIDPYTHSIYQTYGGELTADKVNYFEDTNSDFINKEKQFNQIVKKYLEKEIDEKTYRTSIDNYVQILSDKNKFEVIYNQYISNKQSGYLNDYTGYKILFADQGYQLDYQNVVIILIFMIIVMGRIYTNDQSYNDAILIENTYYERRKRNIIKICLSFLLIFLFTSYVYGSQFILYNQYYPIEFLSIQLSQVIELPASFLASPLLASLTVKNAIILLFVIRLIGVLAATTLVTFISRISHSKTVSILLSSALLIGPLFAYI